MVVVEATTVVLAVLNATNINKLVVLKAALNATDNTITFDQSSRGTYAQVGGGFNKVITAIAFDSSTGLPKAISSNGSTVLTTVGFTGGDNDWFIWAICTNDSGAGL